MPSEPDLPPPTEDPPTETAWERGLRQAKEVYTQLHGLYTIILKKNVVLTVLYVVVSRLDLASLKCLMCVKH